MSDSLAWAGSPQSSLNGSGEDLGQGKRLVASRYVFLPGGARVDNFQSTLPTLPPIFALAASRASSQLAIGCEDSTIRILNILDDELELISKIEVGGPGKVRALSLAWGPPIAAVVSKGKGRGASDSYLRRSLTTELQRTHQMCRRSPPTLPPLPTPTSSLAAPTRQSIALMPLPRGRRPVYGAGSRR